MRVRNPFGNHHSYSRARSAPGTGCERSENLIVFGRIDSRARIGNNYMRSPVFPGGDPYRNGCFRRMLRFPAADPGRWRGGMPQCVVNQVPYQLPQKLRIGINLQNSPRAVHKNRRIGSMAQLAGGRADNFAQRVDVREIVGTSTSCLRIRSGLPGLAPSRKFSAIFTT